MNSHVLYILTTGIMAGVYLVYGIQFLIGFRKHNRYDRVRHMLGYTLLYLLLEVFITQMIRHDEGDHINNLWKASSLFELTVMPFYAFILYIISRPHMATKQQFTCHYLVFLIPLTVYLITFSDVVYYLAYTLDLCYGLTAAIFCYTGMRRHKLYISDNELNENPFSLGWFYKFAGLMLIIMFVYMICSLLPINGAMSVYNLVAAIIWVFMAQMLKDLDTEHDMPAINEDNEYISREHTTPADAPIEPADVPVQSTMDKNFAIIAERLEEQCIRQYLYLDETLTCASLAKKLGTNTRYLSNYLNHVQHVTFNEYINNLRLDLASNMLLNTDDPMERISVACGFAHMSRFHRAFQKKFNCSPGLYHQQMRAAKETLLIHS